jgi:hypothetical protein
MSLLITKLGIAIDISRRAYPSADPDTAERRLDAFREAFERLAHYKCDDDEWAEDSLEAAWDLVGDARSKGSLLTDILSDFADAYDAIVRTVPAPPSDQRRKPRRDA